MNILTIDPPRSPFNSCSDWRGVPILFPFPTNPYSSPVTHPPLKHPWPLFLKTPTNLPWWVPMDSDLRSEEFCNAMEATLKRQVQQQNTSFQEVQRRFLQALEIFKNISTLHLGFPNMAVVKIPIWPIGNTSSIRVHVPASHVSLLQMSYTVDRAIYHNIPHELFMYSTTVWVSSPMIYNNPCSLMHSSHIAIGSMYGIFTDIYQLYIPIQINQM